MLNRTKLARELGMFSDKLFVDRSRELEIARTAWNALSHDVTFLHKVRSFQGQAPYWHDRIDTVFPIEPLPGSYCVMAVDGSQVYPDRHQGLSCFVLNIGKIVFDYSNNNRPVWFDSEPYVCHDEVIPSDLVSEFGQDIVNALRQELELRAGLDLGRQYTQKENALNVVLFDGSLIFWHLESKDAHYRDYFFSRYIHILQEFYKEHIPVASYISAPKSKELVNLIRLSLCNFETHRKDLYSSVDHVLDMHVVQFFLRPYERTTIFQNNAKISFLYPDYIRSHFFYLHTGREIGRVEIPAWIAQDEKCVTHITQIIIDQIIKGNGYPIVLAEAHEQAVIKGPDRDFFYHLLSKLSIEHKQRLVVSQKSLKKRGIGI